MHKVIWRGVLALALAGTAGCEPEVDELEYVEADATALPGPGEVEYQVDTLPFIRERRPVIFHEREWWPREEPVFDPLVTPVGTFEGVVLYTTAEETLPYTRLFVPAEGRRWLVLEPRTPLP